MPPTNLSGWRVARRGELRRPGARPTSRDCYLIAIFHAKGITNPFTDPRIVDQFWYLKERLSDLNEAAERMEAALKAVVFGRIHFTYRLHQYMLEDEWNAYFESRHRALGSYLGVRGIPGSYWIDAAGILPPSFEKDAAPWDFRHQRILALRRKLARDAIGRHVRRAITQRAIAFYWQEATQRALCAPGGAGRAADEATFASEFV